MTNIIEYMDIVYLHDTVAYIDGYQDTTEYRLYTQVENKILTLDQAIFIMVGNICNEN